MKRTIWNPEREALIKALRLEGRTLHYVAERLAVSESAVYLKLAEMGLTNSRGPRKPAERIVLGPQSKRLCFAGGCYTQASSGSNFCDTHQYEPPANVDRLTAGRA